MTKQADRPKVIETVEREAYVDLTLDEVRAKGEDLAQLDLQITQETEQLKEYTKSERSRITSLENRLHQLADTVRQRRELRMVQVDIVEAGDGYVSEIRKDSGELLRTRPISDAERQRSLPNIGTVEATA